MDPFDALLRAGQIAAKVREDTLSLIEPGRKVIKICDYVRKSIKQMDGEQAFREMRNINQNVKVIISSGYNEFEIEGKFAGKNLAGFIQKPYRLNDLKNTIIKVLEKNNG